MMMKLMQISCFAFSMHLFARALSQEYTAPANDVKELIRTEEEIVKSLRQYVKTEKKRIAFLEKYLARSKLEYDIAIKDVHYYFGNPINAFTIIKRLGPDLEHIEDIMRNKTKLQPPAAAFPTEEDLMSSALALATTVDIYQLNISQVANGILNATIGPNKEVFTEITTPMTASDCHTIGMFLFLKELYSEAVPWLEEASKKLEGVQCDICMVSVTDVIDNICKAYMELGNKAKYIEWAEKRVALSPDDDPVTIEYDRHIKVMRSKLMDEFEEEEEEIPLQKNHSIPLGICLATTNPNSKRLSCRYAHGPHPVLTLGPLKVEQVHRNPDLELFYDALSEGDVEAIKALTSSKQWKSKTRRDLDVFVNAEFFEFEDGASASVARANRRAAELSGLGGEASPLSVINYSIGRFKRQSLKTVKKLKAISNEISETVIFYLSNVELGGASMFPLLNLSVYPKKRAALFYSTKLPSGEWSDDLLAETSCPILCGSKWVAVKHYTNTNRCRVWKTEKGVVNHKMYKKILKDRLKRMNRLEQSRPE